MNTRFKISVVIPVYNVEDYLHECIDSVINQSIGFECIQLILINDGSNDASSQICSQYQRMYPNNIFYIEQDNLGVSAARNRGLEIAEGDLVTFLDGDDKWSCDSFRIMLEASETHKCIDVFSSRMEFFDADFGPHQLNYKYVNDKVVDIMKDYNYPQMSSSSVFIRSELVKNYRYNVNVRYSEDCLFINEILLDVGKYMVLHDPVYLYRRRNSGSSATQGSVVNPDYYISTCKNVYLRLFDLSVKRYGEVIPYIQFCIMYDLRWRLKVPLSKTGLNETEANQYLLILRKLLSKIEDGIILDQKRISLALQLFALELKYDNPIQDRIAVDNYGIVSYIGSPIFDISKQTIIRITSISTPDSSIEISGEVNIPFSEDRFSLYYCINEVKNKLPLVKTGKNTKTYLYGVLRSDYDFSISVPQPQSKKNDLRFEICFDNKSFYVCPKYSTSSQLDSKRGIFESSGILAFRHGCLLTITKSKPITKIRALFGLF